ncbi:MAG TPA: AraC family transcriptional regulator [Longimicrobiales bacterium]
MSGHAVFGELCLIRPPYLALEPIEPTWWPRELPLPGHALVWKPHAGTRPETLERMLARPPGLPLFLVLPPPGRVGDVVFVLARLHDLAPRAVLPDGPLAGMESFRALLTAHARPLAIELTDYLLRRGLLPASTLAAVKQVLELAGSTRSITALCRRMYLSRRTLGRHFELEGIPVPSHWLQMGRLLHVAARLQREHATAFRAAVGVGYPDGFTMSNQMKRLLGVRPTEVRECLGWEWIVEAWVKEESARGGYSRERFADALAPYLENDCEECAQVTA